MGTILTNGKINIGAYTFRDRKRVALCVEEGNRIVVCGYFNRPENADFFVDKLGELIGLKDGDTDA